MSKQSATRIILLGFLMLLCSSLCSAQGQSTTMPRPDTIKADKSSPGDDNPPLTTMEEEMRAKRAIKYAEKEHKENLERADEIADLGKGLASSFKQKKLLNRDDVKRLDRLEKLTKKARSEAGGEDSDDTLDKKPSDLEGAVSQIHDVSSSLSEKIKQTPRQVLSAGVIDEANVLLELIKVVRTMIH
jgi:hypothetical protein